MSRVLARSDADARSTSCFDLNVAGASRGRRLGHKIDDDILKCAPWAVRQGGYKYPGFIVAIYSPRAVAGRLDETWADQRLALLEP